jgi:hypothetical protein
VVETATILPDGDYLGQVTCEGRREDLVPDVDDDASCEDRSGGLVPDEDPDEIGEHERQYLDAADIVGSPGAEAEALLRHGRAARPVIAGTGLDLDNVWASAPAILEDGVFRQAGLCHGPLGLDVDAGLALLDPVAGCTGPIVRRPAVGSRRLAS